VLLACKKPGHQAINDQANAQLDEARALTAREKRYATCDEPRPPEALCGTISGSFWNDSNVTRAITVDCHGVADANCTMFLVDRWFRLLGDRYPGADMGEIRDYCAAHSAECEEPLAFELVWLRSHNHQVDLVAQGATKRILDQRDAALANERQRSAQAFAAAMQALASGTNAGSVRSTAPGNQPSSAGAAGSCSSNVDCPVGEKCLKAEHALHGVCGQIVNEYGNRVWDTRAKPAECRVASDCGVRFECVKSGAGGGVCVKR
jgi:hypothetical protein